MERLVCNKCTLPVILQAHADDDRSKTTPRTAVIGCKLQGFNVDDPDLDTKLQKIENSDNYFCWECPKMMATTTAYVNRNVAGMDRLYFSEHPIVKAFHLHFNEGLKRNGVYMFKEVDPFEKIVEHKMWKEKDGRIPREVSLGMRSVYDIMMIHMWYGSATLKMQPSSPGRVFFLVYRDGTRERVIGLDNSY
jgi:hypothetical protein